MRVNHRGDLDSCLVSHHGHSAYLPRSAMKISRFFREHFFSFCFFSPSFSLAEHIASVETRTQPPTRSRRPERGLRLRILYACGRACGLVLINQSSSIIAPTKKSLYVILLYYRSWMWVCENSRDSLYKSERRVSTLDIMNTLIISFFGL